jgi:subtilisin family serine protease
MRVAVVLALALGLAQGELRAGASRRGLAVPDSWIVHVQTSVPGCERVRAAINAFVSRGLRAVRDDGFAVHAACLAHVVGSRQLAEGAVAFVKQQLLGELPELAGLELEQDQVVESYAVPGSYGQDRLDQASLPLDGVFTPGFSGAGVNIYVVDTGINQAHVEFTGRATFLADVTGEGATDGAGHGTHCSGTAGSRKFGVAQGASLFGIKVLTSQGSGSNTDVIKGIDMVIAHRQQANKPGVLSMSLGGGFSNAMNARVVTAANSGLIVVVAAGNDADDACNHSPAAAGGKGTVITVGSTTSTDTMSSFSNFGKCVDIFAPGSAITSTWIGSTTITNTISGTSMACPFVAGAAALFLEAGKGNAAAARTALMAAAVPGKVASIGPGSPNKLLQIPRAAATAPTAAPVTGVPTPLPSARPSARPTTPKPTSLPTTRAPTLVAPVPTAPTDAPTTATDAPTTGAPSAPDLTAWTCPQSFFDANDGCDCDCGFPTDPDCERPDNQQLFCRGRGARFFQACTLSNNSCTSRWELLAPDATPVPTFVDRPPNKAGVIDGELPVSKLVNDVDPAGAAARARDSAGITAGVVGGVVVLALLLAVGAVRARRAKAASQADAGGAVANPRYENDNKPASMGGGGWGQPTPTEGAMPWGQPQGQAAGW